MLTFSAPMRPSASLRKPPPSARAVSLLRRLERTPHDLSRYWNHSVVVSLAESNEFVKRLCSIANETIRPNVHPFTNLFVVARPKVEIRLEE